MVNKRAMIIIAIIIFAGIIITIGGDSIGLFGEKIDTEEKAKSKGLMIFKEEYPDIDYSKYRIRAEFNGEKNLWIVYTEIPPKDNVFTLGGGPVVHITNNGKVKYLMIQQ